MFIRVVIIINRGQLKGKPLYQEGLFWPPIKETHQINLSKQRMHSLPTWNSQLTWVQNQLDSSGQMMSSKILQLFIPLSSEIFSHQLAFQDKGSFFVSMVEAWILGRVLTGPAWVLAIPQPITVATATQCSDWPGVSHTPTLWAGEEAPAQRRGLPTARGNLEVGGNLEVRMLCS